MGLFCALRADWGKAEKGGSSDPVFGLLGPYMVGGLQSIAFCVNVIPKDVGYLGELGNMMG